MMVQHRCLLPLGCRDNCLLGMRFQCSRRQRRGRREYEGITPLENYLTLLSNCYKQTAIIWMNCKGKQEGAMGKVILGLCNILMNRNLIKISKNSNEGVSLHLRIQREVDMITQRVVARRRLALSLKQPVKYGKIQIKELFRHQKKPVFNRDAKCLTQRTGDQTEGKCENNEEKKEFKILNKFSSSFYQGNRFHLQKKVEGEQLKNELRLSHSIQLKRIQQTRGGLMDVGRQLKMVANLKEAKDAAIKQQRNRATSYMNNFITHRINKFRPDDGNKQLPCLTGRLWKMKSKIEGWEETGITEDEDFLQM